MGLRDDLRPTAHDRVIDLVREAGIDVSDWSKFEGGAAREASNPKYCYEWAFVDRDKTVVLNLWFDNLKEQRGKVSVNDNLRRHSEDLTERGAKAAWIQRARRMDEAIQLAATYRATVRVIVIDGDRRDSTDPHGRSSVVRRRMLDPVPWAVQWYDHGTGDFRLVRGVQNHSPIDQFDLHDVDGSPADRRTVVGEAFVRDPAVRHAVLKRAAGRCEYCLAPGFLTASGSVFLETHHIVPLAEGGVDSVRNVAALCPNHHREAHYGASAVAIRAALTRTVSVASRRGPSEGPTGLR